MALDKRMNYKFLKRQKRQRFIDAVKWLKANDIGGTASTTGGAYQKYVDWYADKVKVDYCNKFDYSLNISLATLVDADRLISVRFDSTDAIKPVETIFMVDYLAVQAFLNNLFTHELSSSDASSLIGHSSTTSSEKVAMFSISDNGSDLMIQCPNSPYLLVELKCEINGVETTIPFVQTPRSTDNKWSLSNLDIAHGGSTFLPWHRVFLRLFELDLKTADIALGNNGKITLPYWDWVSDNDAIGLKGYLWKNEGTLFGEDGNAGHGTMSNIVDTGPFKYPDWKIFPSPSGSTSEKDYLTREIGRATVGGVKDPWTMPNTREVEWLMERRIYDVYPYDESSSAFSFRNVLEGWYGLYTNARVTQPSQMTNGIHLWVGGTMANVRLSVNDPVFFLHMANVDRIWSRWQKTVSDTKKQYPEFGPLPGRRRSDEMLPWASVVGYPNPITPEDVLEWEEFPTALLSVLGVGYKYV